MANQIYRRKPDAQGKVMVQSSPHSLACKELIFDRQAAIDKAKQEALKENEYRFVIPFEEGFLVLSWADVSIYFDPDTRDQAIFKADPPAKKK